MQKKSRAFAKREPSSPAGLRRGRGQRPRGLRAAVRGGRVELAYPSVLTLYAIRQVADGRRQGTELNIRDVSSKRCRLKKEPQLERLEPSSLTGKPWMLQYIATPGSTACASLVLHLE